MIIVSEAMEKSYQGTRNGNSRTEKKLFEMSLTEDYRCQKSQ